MADFPVGHFSLKLVPPISFLAKRHAGRNTAKAYGEDCVPGSLHKAAFSITSQLLFPVVARASLRFEEPLMWRGSYIAALYKGKGDARLCSNSRDVWVESLESKDFHSYLRGMFFPKVAGFARPSQCGGIDSKGADIAQHFVRAVWDFAGVTSSCAALLFVDLSAAFASL
eukprot:10777104-Lingulodinium_polyedra.AAC.1